MKALAYSLVPFILILRIFIKIWRINLSSSTVKEVPIWEKSNLTVEEAAAYTGIGINKIREMSNGDNCPFVLWVGNKRLIKRRIFDEYVEKQFSI